MRALPHHEMFFHCEKKKIFKFRDFMEMMRVLLNSYHARRFKLTHKNAYVMSYYREDNVPDLNIWFIQ